MASAGSAMHLLIALVLALDPGLHLREDDEQLQRGRPRALAGEDDAGGRWPAYSVGDTIVSVNGKNFTNPDSLTNAMKDSSRPVPQPGGRARRQAHPPDRQPVNGKGVTIEGHEARGPRLPRHQHQLGDHLRQPARPPGAALPPCGTSPTRRRTESVSCSRRRNLRLWHQVTNPRPPVRRRTRDLAPRACSIVGIADIGTQTDRPASTPCCSCYRHQYRVRHPQHAADDPARWGARRHRRIRVDPYQAGPGRTTAPTSPNCSRRHGLRRVPPLVFVAASVFLDIAHPLQLFH